MAVSYHPWTSIFMDFIVGLPETDGKTKIWVIVDCFSKMSHIIALSSVNKTVDLVKISLTKVWKHHSLPDNIVSYQNSMSISHFWQSPMDIHSVKLNLSMDFHPQTDGQSERVNQTREDYMLNYCSYQ
jgi:hypothetical protein